ncbi:MAG: GNAT family protein [Thermodesulfobacteriota bacterium]|nr:GNAT family protein [Thermodesulfobacteriota bacterium]
MPNWFITADFAKNINLGILAGESTMTDRKPTSLRRPEEEDINRTLEWIEDKDYYYFLVGEASPSWADSREKMLGRFEASSGYDSNIHMVIELGQDTPAGMILLHSINWKNRNAFIKFYLPNDNRTKSYASDAFLASFDFAFHELNLHKICIYLFEYEKNFVKIVEKIGGKREVVLKSYFYDRNRSYDLYLYGVLRGEYEEVIGKSNR